MSDCNCKTESCIRCEVKNCVYHTSNDSCDAGSIQVGCCQSGGSSTAKDTCCDTFKAKF